MLLFRGWGKVSEKHWPFCISMKKKNSLKWKKPSKLINLNASSMSGCFTIKLIRIEFFVPSTRHQNCLDKSLDLDIWFKVCTPFSNGRSKLLPNFETGELERVSIFTWRLLGKSGWPFSVGGGDVAVFT